MRKALTPLDPSYFEKAKLTSFEIFSTRLEEIPIKPELIPQISRAKFCRCQLKHFPKGIEAYHYIKVLDISENEIEDVQEEDFSGLIVVQYLDMSLNLLKSISPSLPQTLVHLDLSFNVGINVDCVWNLELPHLETLRMTHCKLSNLPKNKPEWSDSLKSFALDGNMFNSVPQIIASLPCLEEVSFFGNSFTICSLPQSDHPLRLVNFNQNPIQSIDPSISNRVQSFCVNSCPLTFVPQALLNLTGIRVIMLSNTQINGEIDIVLPNQLAILDLSYNQIDSLSSNFVQSCGNVSVINFCHNKLKSIPDEFPSPLSFSQILLNFNELEELPQSMLASKSLEKFFVSHNNLKKIPDFRFPQLREIDFSFNKLDSLPDSFSISSFLVTVNVSYNQLTDLPKSMSSCRRLLDLMAAGNKFESLPRCIFGFASLRLLILSNNKLTALPSSMSSFFFLKTLDLSNNYFVEVPKQIEALHSIKTLSMSHNSIDTVGKNYKFPSMIVSLDLSFNQIKEFPFENPLPCLSALSLACNLLTYRDLSFFPSLHFYSDFGNQIIEDKTNYEALKTLRILESFENDCLPPNEPTKHIMIPKFTNSFDIGYSSMLGPRPTMEDAVFIYSCSPDDLIVALFDGHAGFGAADASSRIIKNEYLRIYNCDIDDLSDMISSSFGNIQAYLTADDIEGGCTAAMAVISRGRVFAAGLGDSRVLRVKKFSCERITTDHKPLNTDEFNRLQDAGLGVTAEGRIRRKLAVARALGDFWCGEGLFVQPEVTSFVIDDDDLGIIIACDGLWDVFDDENAARVLRESKTAEDAAITLKNSGLALSTTDNISVSVVMFKSGGFQSKDTVERIPILQLNEPENDEPIIIASPVSTRRRR